jgi:hypothetical protein
MEKLAEDFSLRKNSLFKDPEGKEVFYHGS